MAKEAPEELPGMTAYARTPYGKAEMRPEAFRESGAVLLTSGRKAVRHVVLSCGY